MRDRRQLKRWQVAKQAKLKLEAEQGFVDCYIADLNLRGFRLACGQKLDKDTYIKFTLKFSDEFSFELEAWVAWHKSVEGQNIYGLYFSKIRDVDKERIYQFIRENFPEQLKQQWWQENYKEVTPGAKRNCASVRNDEGGGIMEEERTEDRRVFERFSADLPVRFLNPLTGKEGAGLAKDISAKGMGLVTDEALALASPLELWLEIPDQGEPLYSRGQVAWVKQEGASSCCAGISLEKADLMGLSRVMRTL